MSSKVYEMVRDRILGALERGVAPWRCPWVGGGRPTNLVTRREYSGINLILTQCSGRSRWWLTYRQAAALGGQVRRGEKSTPIVFYSPIVTKSREDGTKARVEGACILRYYSAFSLDQVEGIPDPDLGEPEGRHNPDPIEAIEAMVESMPKRPPILWGGTTACYRPATDEVTMPDRSRFSDASALYSTLLHELAHATGHKDRLGRRKNAAGRSLVGYAAEELVAEVASCLVMQAAGLEPRVEESAAYCESWSRQLRGMDSAQAVCRAMTAAVKAADWIQGRTRVESESESVQS